MARNKFPGQRNSLDALANRFEVSGYDRSFHGALLDANILADVYIHLTGGQSKFEFMTSNINSNSESDINDSSIDLKKFPIPKIMVSKEDMLANDQRIKAINSKRDQS
jgi:DNA polymerase III epsilon subunit-like protein